MAAHATRSWEQGQVESPPAAGRRLAVALAVTTVLGLVIAGLFHLLGSPVALLTPDTATPSAAHDGRAEIPPGDGGAVAASPGQDEPSHAGDVSIPHALAQVPEVRTGLAFLEIGDPLEMAVAVLGPADAQMADINATTTHTWMFDDGAELSVTVADELGILGLYASAPADGTLRPTAWGAVTVGASTPADVVDRWGSAYDLPEVDGDFVLRYIECVGPWPVVVKFDQAGAGPDVRWDEPITSVMIGFADADPGTEGCPRQQT
jgi:hypothetical protein